VNVTREVLIPIRDGRGVYQVNTCYRAAHGLGLFQLYSEMEGSDTFGAVYQRLSDDNGRTWSEPALDFRPHDVQEGWLQGVSPGGIRGVHRWGESALFLDEDNGAVLHFFNDDIYPQGSYSGDVRKYTRILIRTSRDGGQSFDDGTQLVQKGFDPVRWAAGVERGRNSIATSFCAPIKTATMSAGFRLRTVVSHPVASGLLCRAMVGRYARMGSRRVRVYRSGRLVARLDRADSG
jgi:hypothetical protein